MSLRFSFIFFLYFFPGMTITWAQRVGIGNGAFTPTNTLEVRANGNAASDSAFQVKNNSGSVLFFVNGAGNVGIASLAPGAKLSINASGENIYFGTGTNSTAYSANAPVGSSIVGRGSVSDYRITLDPNSNNGRVNHYWNSYASADGVWKYIVGGNESAVRMMVNSNGTTGGQFGFFGAPGNSGAAGAAITWVQTGLISTADRIWFSPRGNSTDFFINSSGLVGIGTSSPTTTRLHLAGTLKINDGNQGANKVIVSDANGVGTWTSTSSVPSQETQISFLTSSTGTFTVTTGVTLIWITMWGGGGGGGTFNSSQAGSGGGGSEVIYRRPLKVTGGATLSYTVGGGGAASTAGSDTKISGFNGSAELIAKGGSAGGSSTSGKGGGADSLISGKATTDAVGIAGREGPWFIGGSSGGASKFNGTGYAGALLVPYSGGATGSGNHSGGGGGAGFFGAGAQGGTDNNNGNSASANSGAGGGGAGRGVSKTGGSGGSGGIIIEWVSP